MDPLSQLKEGQCARIVSIDGNRQLLRRLLSLGLRIGAEIEVMKWRSSGVVLANANNRVALSADLIPFIKITTINKPADHSC